MSVIMPKPLYTCVRSNLAGSAKARDVKWRERRQARAHRRPDDRGAIVCYQGEEKKEGAMYEQV
jgi:hypothetical protein